MAINTPLYKKFGVAAPDFAPLVAGQKEVGNSLKEALNGIGDLLNKQEQQAVESNTLNMQAYLKDNIKKAGLGAEPTDTTNIRQRFGSLINMDQVDQTINDTRQEMVGEAMDEGEAVAGQVFAQTEDLAEAGKALRQRLINAGMRETEAAKLERGWRTDNQFLVEDVKLNNERMVDDFTNSVMDTIVSHDGDASTQEVINHLSAGLPEKIRTQGILKARKVAEELKEQSPDQIAAHQHLARMTQIPIDELTQEMELQKAQAKAAIDGIEYLPKAAYDGARELQSRLGGMGKPIGEDVTGRFFKVGELQGNKLTSALRDRINNMITNKGVDPDEAYAIAFQAYNDSRDERKDGVAVDPALLGRQFDLYENQYEQKKKAEAQYTKLLEEIVKKRSRMISEREHLLESVRKGQRFSNLSGKEFNAEEKFRNSIFGGRSNTPQQLTVPDASDGSSSNNDSPFTDEVRKLAENNLISGENSGASGSWEIEPTPGSGGRPELDFSGTGQGTLLERMNRVRNNHGQYKVPSIDERAESIRVLSRDEQKDAISAMEKRIGKSLTDKVRKRLKENPNPSKSGQAATGSVFGEINLSPSMMQAIARMPSNDAAAKDTAERIRTTRDKNEWPEIISAIRATNPELANKLAKLLKVG